MFISKKQKKIMKERRKKKQLVGSTNKRDSGATDDTELKDHSEEGENEKSANNSKDVSQLQKLAGPESVTFGMTNERAETNFSLLPSNGKKVVVVPSNMNSKEAKKFRKDARRQVRNDGINADAVTFVSDREEPKHKESLVGSEKSSRPDNKRKREFPNINQLLEEEQQAAKKRARKEGQDKAESQISDEVKDRYRAVDCEMVGIGSNGKISALARVSVTNWSGDVLLDTYVKVPSRVTDFRTKYSGVSVNDLKSESAMDVNDCRARVAALLKSKILVGHALKNDLDVLFLSHPKEDIRDTARYPPYQRLEGKKLRPRKLRDLVKEYCDTDIQREGESHDSVDDAKAAMELFKVAREAWEAEMQRKRKKKKVL